MPSATTHVGKKKSTHTAICGVCYRRICLFPYSATLCIHGYHGNPCAASSTDYYTDVEPRKRVHYFRARKISNEQLREHTELRRPRAQPAPITNWKKRWQEKTGVQVQ